MEKKTDSLNKGGTLYITFSAYLDKLRADEGAKPPTTRKAVPTIRDLARMIRERHGIKLHEVTLNGIVNDSGPMFNKETVKMLLDEMWYLGFAPQITDFTKYVPPESKG